MKLRHIGTRTLKRAFHAFGLEIIRSKNSPSLTFLGLRNFQFHTIIDVGANTGQFAKIMSGMFPSAKLYCFEPLPEPFDALNSWARARKELVSTFNVAVGNEQGLVEMNLHENHTSSSSLLATTRLSDEYYPITKEQRKISVQQTTLDAELTGILADLRPGALVKLDVQGYEDRVISGGTSVLSQASACIVEVCVDGLYEGQAGFSQLVSMLDSVGLIYAGNVDQSYGEDGHCIFLDALFLRKTDKSHSK